MVLKLDLFNELSRKNYIQIDHCLIGTDAKWVLFLLEEIVAR